MEILKFLKKTTKWQPGFQLGDYFYEKELEIRPRVKCRDGFEVSVQASRYHYCSPRVNLEDGYYSQVELGFPNGIMSDEINKHAERGESLLETVYAYVDIDLVEKEIQEHGGIAWEELEGTPRKTSEEDRLKKLGIDVRDEDGKLKPMIEIVEELEKRE